MNRLGLLLLTLACFSSRGSAFSVARSQATSIRPRTTELKALALDTAFDSFATIETFFSTQPYLSAFLTCSFKASAADLVAQTQQQQQQDDAEKNLDLSRNLAFLFYGGLYQGMVQQFIYTTLFPSLFGSEHTLQTVAMQVATDMGFIGPFICLPIAYSVKAAFSSDELTLESLKGGLNKYVEDIMTRSLLFKYWGIWIPVQSLTFGVIPSHFRVLFVAFVSFFWVCILSSVSSDESNKTQDIATSTSSSLATPKKAAFKPL